MFKKILILGIVFSLVLVVSLFAQTIIKDDFRVNDDFTIGGSNQSMPAIAMDHQGNFVVVWLDRRNGSKDIYGQIFDRWGNPAGQNFKVNDAVGIRNYVGSKLEVAMDADGNFVVVWDDYRNDFSDVYAQRYDSDGTPLGNNFRVNDDLSKAYQIDPAVAMTPSGEFVVVWKDYRNLPHSIYGQRFSSSGSRIGSNFEIVMLPFIQGLVGPSQIEASINPKGDFVTTWVAEIYSQSDSQTYKEIHAIRVSAKNEVFGSEFKVNDSDSLAFPDYPDVAMDACGDFVITWMEKRPYLNNIYAQRYDFKGEALGNNFKVNELSRIIGSGLPKVAMNLSKEFLIAWIELREELCIYVQDYDQRGEPEGGNVRLASLSGWGPQKIDIAKSPSGYFALTWDGNECIYDMDIFAMILDPKKEVVKSRFKVESDSGSSLQSSPALAVAPSGTFALSWDDIRLCNQNIFGQRFTSNGEFSGPNFKVNQGSGETIVGYQSAISMDSLGNCSIAFLSGGNVYLQKYDLKGNQFGENLRVNEMPELFFAYNPDIALSAKGDIMVVWSRSPYADRLIFAQLYDSQGSKIDSNFMVNSFVNSNSSSDYPKVAWAPNGNLVVIWENYNRSWNRSEIWGQLFDNLGNRVGVNFKVGDSAVNMGNYTLDVGMDEQGNFVVAWSIGWNIAVQRFKSDGSKAGTIIKAIDPNGTKTYNLSLAVKSDGEFLVVWEDRRNGDQDIYAQRFDSEGNPLGGNFRVNSDQGDNTQMSPVVAADDKNYYFSWVDNRVPDGGFDIFAKIISFEPTLVSEPGASAKPEFSLLQNYPNPFNPTTTIPFTVSCSKSVAHVPIPTILRIYNILGQKVRTLVDEDKLPGSYQVIWDGKDEGGKEVSSGVYFYVIKTQDLTQTRKMTLLK